jgi:hypothetical protein
VARWERWFRYEWSSSPHIGLGALLLLVGCERLLDAPDYHVVSARELVANYAVGSEACAACLGAGECGRRFDACVELPGCAEFASCLVEESNPATSTRCAFEHMPSSQVLDSAARLNDCFSGCTACWDGRDFACVDGYEWPGNPPSATVRVAQTLRLLDIERKPAVPLANATVSFCSGTNQCSLAPPQVTDANGRYEVDLPILTGAPSGLSGFLGYRRVEKAELELQWLRTNVPILSSRSETTGLLDRGFSQALRGLAGIMAQCEHHAQPAGELRDDPAKTASPAALRDGIVAFQVFDCRGVGAGGVTVRVANAEGHRVEYLRATTAELAEVATRVGRCDYDPGELGQETLASVEGAGALFFLERGRRYDIQAYLRGGDRIVAEDTITVPEQGLLLISLYPRWRQE